MLTIYEISRFRSLCLVQQIIAGNYPNLQIQLIFITNFHNHPTRYSENNTLLESYRNTSIGDRGIQYTLQREWNSLPANTRNQYNLPTIDFRDLIYDQNFQNHEDIAFDFSLNSNLPLPHTTNRHIRWVKGGDSMTI